jgi:hypothetical protein
MRREWRGRVERSIEEAAYERRARCRNAASVKGTIGKLVHSRTTAKWLMKLRVTGDGLSLLPGLA